MQTLLEVISPPLCCFLLVMLRTLVTPEKHAARFYTPFEPNIKVLDNNEIDRVYWSPFNQELEVIIIHAVSQLNREYGCDLKPIPVPNSQSLHAVLMENSSALVGIEFDDAVQYGFSIPNELYVTLRFPGELRLATMSDSQDSSEYSWVTHLIFPMYQMPGPRDYELNEGAKPEYNGEGFLKLQMQLGISLIHYWMSMDLTSELLDSNFSMNIKMQRFPHPPWISDKLLTALRLFVSLIIMLSTVYTCVNNVRVVTAEKEKQLKEAMRIMGLPNWLHWLAWFVKTFIMMFISQILVVALFKIKWFGRGAIFPQSNPLVILYFLCFFVSATTTFCFAISVFFAKANLASTVTGMVWFLSFFPYSFLQSQYDTLSLFEKLLACLSSTSAMGYGFQIILMYEGIGVGIQWDNIGSATSPDDTLTLNVVVAMLIFDTILYMMITIYVEAVFPGETGVPQVWYFPFTKTYWFGARKYMMVEDKSKPTEPSDFFEPEPENLYAGIRIIRLEKKYSNRVAVKDLNLKMYRDQITVLLGHNGAGKTTTMSMLTGLIRPTNGTAIIDGYDIRTDKKRARKSIGLCPQYNVLFDELTVAEHLYFFTRLKGIRRNRINAEIKKYVELLELDAKKNSPAGTLSGGMQRKLSVGIALCGNSQIVMLDEPTAGMDPAARRALWDLLISQKQGRTMLLSTHFMDEADLLGDRIAIMSGGVLQCCGSSFFLKKKYGAGYHLIMEKSSRCVVSSVTKLLAAYIPGIQVKSEVGKELTYVLGEEYAPVFEEMLNKLEHESKALGIESYGISLTTLEEVFMMVGADDKKEPQQQTTAVVEVGIVQYMVKSNRKYNKIYEMDREAVLLTGWQLWFNQFEAMLTKRMLTVYRAWALFLVQNVLAVLFISLAIIVVRNVKYYDDMPELLMTLSAYYQSITVVTSSDYNIYASQYISHLKNNGYELINVTNGNMNEVIYNEIINNYVRVRQRYICGASFDDNGLIAWFNTETYHAAPLCLQLLLNSVLKSTIGFEFEMVFINHPMKFTSETKFRDLATGHNMGYQIAFNLGFGMAFVSSFYIIYYIKERASKAKHIQFVSGVGVVAFWGSSFIIDFLTFIFTSFCICLAILCFNEDGFNTFDDIKHVFCALMCFAYTMLPLTYLAAFLFDIPATGYTKMSLCSVFLGVAGFLGIQMLRTPGLDLDDLADNLHWGMLIVPHYALSSFIRDTNILYVIHSICDNIMEKCLNVAFNKEMCLSMICIQQEKCCTTTKHYYDWEYPGVGRNVFYSLLVGTVCIIILLLIEYKVIRKIRHKLRKTKYVPPDSKIVDIHVDIDIQQENEYIRNAPYEEIRQHNLFMRDISKCYGKFVAVNNICLAVKKLECFGLLGLNGAGKTTTFKIMTGDIKCTSGDAWINGVPLKGHLKTIQRMIGYCPQFDALLDDLTCRETLKIFSMLRGLPEPDAKQKAEKLALEFDFVKHLDKQVYALSGGNKRKLSTAISVIGGPDVLYLDEPTTGMDPATKRFLWDALCKIRDRGTCIVLTSHSMEECEALCTRIAIMVNGMFVCMGSPQHLKTRFSDGYTLMIKLKKGTSTVEIEDYIEEHLPTAELREKHQEMLTYYIIQDDNLKWSTLFGVMQKAKLNQNIEDYSVGQSTLEQVFLSFTKYQSEKYKIKGKKKRRHLEVLK
ncbi:hypothetical protein RN001_009415 [Aquatica leii]|uniref:ABC transporter domain-containing protein n=1 Tax=Aquatica leii TaxID=1421715 RepID=A0AAN7P4N5_9COLE|nr:hypothetical protein RN001_009415 [Aquatica leii]